MLRIDVDKKKELSTIEASGPLPEILNDLLLVIGSIGQGLNDKDHVLGAVYEAALKAALNDGAAISKRALKEGEFVAMGSGSGLEEALMDAFKSMKNRF